MRKVIIMQKWEYKEISCGMVRKTGDKIWLDTKLEAKSKEAVTNRLNKEGQQGWELTSKSTPIDTEEIIGLEVFYLRRPLE